MPDPLLGQVRHGGTFPPQTRCCREVWDPPARWSPCFEMLPGAWEKVCEGLECAQVQV